jgi:hypothetical protein
VQNGAELFYRTKRRFAEGNIINVMMLKSRNWIHEIMKIQRHGNGLLPITSEACSGSCNLGLPALIYLY